MAAAGAALGSRAAAGERQHREDAVARAVARVSPAVVRVEARDTAAVAQSSSPAGTPWRDDGVPDLPAGLARLLPGDVETASGVIVSPDGYILTAGGLFRDATRRARVALADGRRFDATLIGRDAVLDISVLKVAAQGLPYVELASEAGVRPGELVIALGDPFGVALDGQAAASVGVVSAVRPIASEETTYAGELIETDAAINPGVQGGPLADLDGRLVGICSPLLRSKSTDCLTSCAIPVAAIRARLAGLRLDGRPYLGVVLRERGATLTGGGAGAEVDEVVPGSPSEVAGLRRGDRIVAFDGCPTPTARALIAAIEQARAGDVVRVRFERGARVFEVEVVLARRDF
jgi:S1-C subfamily serine protease